MLTITPLTDGTLKMTIKNSAGDPVEDASTAIANVYSPKGVLVGANVPLTYNGTDETWDMPIASAWSSGSGGAIQGEFVARITVESGGAQLTDNVRFIVSFTDKS